MEAALSIIWTRVAVLISNDENHCTTVTNKNRKTNWNTFSLCYKQNEDFFSVYAMCKMRSFFFFDLGYIQNDKDFFSVYAICKISRAFFVLYTKWGGCFYTFYLGNVNWIGLIDFKGMSTHQELFYA